MYLYPELGFLLGPQPRPNNIPATCSLYWTRPKAIFLPSPWLQLHLAWHLCWQTSCTWDKIWNSVCQPMMTEPLSTLSHLTVLTLSLSALSLSTVPGTAPSLSLCGMTSKRMEVTKEVET
jgi:hypothetical protein